MQAAHLDIHPAGVPPHRLHPRTTSTKTTLRRKHAGCCFCLALGIKGNFWVKMLPPTSTRQASVFDPLGAKNPRRQRTDTSSFQGIRNVTSNHKIAPLPCGHDDFIGHISLKFRTEDCPAKSQESLAFQAGAALRPATRNRPHVANSPVTSALHMLGPED